MIFPEERVGSWMKSIFPMPNSDPVQTYSLNFRKQKEKNLAWDSRRLASRRLVRPMVQVTLATRRLVRTPSTFFPAKRPFFTQRTIPTIERKLTLSWWCFFVFFTMWKSIFFTGVVLSEFNLSLRTDWFRVDMKATEDGRLSFSHHLTLLVEIPTKKNLVMITQFFKTCTTTFIKNEIKMPCIG